MAGTVRACGLLSAYGRDGGVMRGLRVWTAAR